LTIITGVPCRETAQRLLIAAGGLRGLQALSTVELQQLVAGISTGRAAQFKAAIELGTRVARGEHLARKQIKSPADVAELLLLKLYLAVVLNLCARRLVDAADTGAEACAGGAGTCRSTTATSKMICAFARKDRCRQEARRRDNGAKQRCSVARKQTAAGKSRLRVGRGRSR
jgi:hypothetical protein